MFIGGGCIPDVERNGDHRVEDDDIRPEGVERRQRNANAWFTGKKRGEG